MTDQLPVDPLAEPAEGGGDDRRSRALVPREAPQPHGAAGRPEANFLAQLIACDRRLPAYRQARMAAPGPATSAYNRPGGVAPARLDCLI